MSRYHVAIVGGGHNALVAAAYLARAGLRVGLFERRDVLGGACVTECIWPGVRVNTAAYVLSLLDPAVSKELELKNRGLQLLRRNPSSFTPLPDGEGFFLFSELDETVRGLKRFSPRDAERFGDYCRQLERIASVFEMLATAPPPDPFQPGLGGYFQSFGLFRAARALGDTNAYAAAELLLGSAGRFLERWFEWPPLQATLATDGIIGAMAGAYTAGTGGLLLHHVMGQAGGQRGVWAYVRGGMGQLCETLALVAREHGAEIFTGKPVRKVLVRKGAVVGLELEDGQEVEATAVVAGCDLKTAVRLVGDDLWPEDFLSRVKTLDTRSPVCKINILCDGLPVFRGLGGDGRTAGPEHSGTIHICPSLSYIQKAYADAERGHAAEHPVLEITIQSAVDPTLAPEGRHVVSVFSQYVPPAWANEPPEQAALDAYVRRCIDTIDAYAPGFSSRILELQVLGPDRLQSVFGLPGGNIFHAAMVPDQMLFLRPAPGWARYRLPVLGYYLGSASAHPGGGVTGTPGRLAALTVLRDWRKLTSAKA